MLDKTVMRSNYRAHYLSVLSNVSSLGLAYQYVWFSGYGTQPRRMFLHSSSVTIESVDKG